MFSEGNIIVTRSEDPAAIFCGTSRGSWRDRHMVLQVSASREHRIIEAIGNDFVRIGKCNIFILLIYQILKCIPLEDR